MSNSVKVSITSCISSITLSWPSTRCHLHKMALPKYNTIPQKLRRCRPNITSFNLRRTALPKYNVVPRKSGWCWSNTMSSDLHEIVPSKYNAGLRKSGRHWVQHRRPTPWHIQLTPDKRIKTCHGATNKGSIGNWLFHLALTKSSKG